jgi:sugar/nucleoside kinase (ribokinase family)
VVVGHLSRDLIITPVTKQEALGGGVAYAMLAPALEALNVGIISKVGEDFEQEYWDILQSSGLSLAGLHKSSQKSTRFVNKYDERGNREQFVESIADQITTEDFTEDYHDVNAIHFSPLTANEVDIESVRLARSIASMISLDVQGFIRSIEEDGRISLRSWIEYGEILGLVDVVKFHEDELRIAIDGESELTRVSQILNLGPRIVLVTRDKRGSTIYTRNEQINIPLIKAKTETDATGCGDVYAIGFLLEYMRTSNLERSGIFAATCSSFNIETCGPFDLPSRHDVETRMRQYLQ